MFLEIAPKLLRRQVAAPGQPLRAGGWANPVKVPVAVVLPRIRPPVLVSRRLIFEPWELTAPTKSFAAFASAMP
jgi:hypothetical protein